MPVENSSIHSLLRLKFIRTKLIFPKEYIVTHLSSYRLKDFRSILNFVDWNIWRAIDIEIAAKCAAVVLHAAKKITLYGYNFNFMAMRNRLLCPQSFGKQSSKPKKKKKEEEEIKWERRRKKKTQRKIYLRHLSVRASRTQPYRRNHILYPMKRINYILNRIRSSTLFSSHSLSLSTLNGYAFFSSLVHV